MSLLKAHFKARLKCTRHIGPLFLLFCVCTLSPPVRAGEFPDLKLPDSMHVKVVANSMRMNGLKTRVYAFRTDKSADEVAAWFADQWDKMARSQFGRWDILAHREDGYLITVQMQKRDLQGIGGYIALSDVFAAVEGDREPPVVSLPMLPDTRVVQNLRADDLGRESHTLVLVSEKSASANLDFYRNYFRNEGFDPISRGALAKGAGAGAMILNNGSAQLNLAAAEHNGQTVITIVKVWQ